MNDETTTPPKRSKSNRYSIIIEKIFFSKYREGLREVPFERAEIERVAAQLKVQLPKNLGDLIYSFRYRALLPASISTLAGEQETWIIRPAGRSKYSFALVKSTRTSPPRLCRVRLGSRF